MKKASIALVLILAVVLVSGMACDGNGNIEPTPTLTPSPTPTPTPAPTPTTTPTEAPEITVGPHAIAILVDENTYQQVKPEIERYVEDIENDLQANVFLYHQNWQSPEEVRNQLLYLRDENLKGAVLIGEIPATYFEGAQCGIEATEFPSDRYYMDLENSSFSDNDGDGKFEIDDYSTKGNLMQIIWVGRIKPPVGGTEGIDLLERYFERNHQYRTGKIDPIKKLLAYSLQIQSGPTLEIQLDNLRDSLTLHRSSDILYTWDEIDILVGSSREEYLVALQNDYEIVNINAHGTEFTQILGDDSISYEDIKIAQPKPYFYFLYSCSNGDYTQENYIGGHYLFDGNGLVVYTATTKSMAGDDEIRKYIRPLALGHSFGEAFVLYPSNRIPSLGLPEVILGDPTLSIRHKIGVPQINVDTSEIDFGEVVAVQVEPPLEASGRGIITIKNTGTGKLIIRPAVIYMENENGIQGYVSPSWHDEPILPGESTTVDFVFWPKEKGAYNGFARIHTNDPANPVIVIELRGKGT